MSDWIKKILARFGKVEVPDADVPELATAAAPAKRDAEPGSKIKIELWVDYEMLIASQRVCADVEGDNPRASAEAKHAMAYARLSRAYPGVAHRDVALAVELGLRSDVFTHRYFAERYFTNRYWPAGEGQFVPPPEPRGLVGRRRRAHAYTRWKAPAYYFAILFAPWRLAY